MQRQVYAVFLYLRPQCAREQAFFLGLAIGVSTALLSLFCYQSVHSSLLHVFIAN